MRAATRSVEYMGKMRKIEDFDEIATPCCARLAMTSGNSEPAAGPRVPRTRSVKTRRNLLVSKEVKLQTIEGFEEGGFS